MELRQNNVARSPYCIMCLDFVATDSLGFEWSKLERSDLTIPLPYLQAAIRKELNDFKSSEMEVHEDSKQFTRYVERIPTTKGVRWQSLLVSANYLPFQGLFP